MQLKIDKITHFSPKMGWESTKRNVMFAGWTDDNLHYIESQYAEMIYKNEFFVVS